MGVFMRLLLNLKQYFVCKRYGYKCMWCPYSKWTVMGYRIEIKCVYPRIGGVEREAIK